MAIAVELNSPLWRESLRESPGDKTARDLRQAGQGRRRKALSQIPIDRSIDPSIHPSIHPDATEPFETSHGSSSTWRFLPLIDHRILVKVAHSRLSPFLQRREEYVLQCLKTIRGMSWRDQQPRTISTFVTKLNPSRELLFQIAFLHGKKGIMLSSTSATKRPMNAPVRVSPAKNRILVIVWKYISCCVANGWWSCH
jgi:hypothetical protein